MKKKEIVDWSLNIIGILLFLYSLGSIKEIILYNLASGMEGPNQDLVKLVFFIFLILQWSIAAILIFRTRFLTNLLFKNENDTEEIAISSFGSIHLFKLGFVLLGVSILVFSLPDFIVEFSKYIFSVQMGHLSRKFELTNILILGLKLFFSLILIMNSTRLSHYFSKLEIVD